jgi:FkbM family methyltransferase
MTPHPTTGKSEAPGERGTPARRAFLFGGLIGGLAGATGGTAVGRLSVPTPPPEVIEQPLPTGTKLSYAQFGEDLIADSLFYALGMDKPTYMDIGAFEPIHSNNTYLFYLRGARGLLVEPNVALTERLKSTRPGDTVLVAGIGLDDTTEADYYVFADRPQENTFDKEQADRLVRDKQYKIEQVVKMPLVNINRAIAEHFDGAAPDYLSIDVEGLEFAILKTLDLKRFRPKVICVDTLVTGTLRHNPASTEYMLANGYDVRGMTYPNMLYIDKQLMKGKNPK